MNEKSASKKANQEDWHRADIVAAVRKAGWSLRKLAKHHGYSSATTLTVALDRPWPKGERLIAEAIGIDPDTIWPSRYAGKDTTGSGKRHGGQGDRKAA
tara:strand:+ start:1243 stop:1539 length:297 start_codon:yes stop_codon:yes gene_type:complete